MNEIDNHRNFMKSSFEQMKNIVSDQMKDLPLPPLEKMQFISVKISTSPMKEKELVLVQLLLMIREKLIRSQEWMEKMNFLFIFLQLASIRKISIYEES